MKNLQKLFASVVLTLLFSVSVFGGDGIITIGKAEPTPTPVLIAMTNNEAEAEGVITTMRTMTDPVMEVVLNLLPSVLALF